MVFNVRVGQRSAGKMGVEGQRTLVLQGYGIASFSAKSKLCMLMEFEESPKKLWSR